MLLFCYPVSVSCSLSLLAHTFEIRIKKTSTAFLLNTCRSVAGFLLYLIRLPSLQNLYELIRTGSVLGARFNFQLGSIRIYVIL